MFEIKIAQYFQSFFVPQLETLWPTLFYWVAVPVEGISWQRNCSCTYLRIPNGTWNVLSAALGQIGFFFLNCPKTASDICKASLLFTGENLLKKIVCVRITRLCFSTQVLYMCSSFWLFGVESRDCSHTEKERTVRKDEQI